MKGKSKNNTLDGEFFDWHSLSNILHLFAFSQETFFNDPNSLKF